MPFEVLDTVVRSAKSSCASISYRRKMNKTGRAKAPTLIVSVPTSLLSGFAPKKDQRFAIHIGTGSDQGKARIVPAESGISASKFIHGIVFRFGYVPALGDDAADKEQCAAKVIGKDQIEITLPAWFKVEP